MRGSPMFVDCGAWLDLVLPGLNVSGELASALSSTDGPNQVEKWEVRERTGAKSKLA
jgi:hypothetical protein